MKKYHKIQTVFKRDPETKNKFLLEGQYSLDEFEFLTRLRSNKIYGNIPVIITCQVAIRATVMQAFKLGIRNFIIKSNDIESFAKKIKDAIDSYHSSGYSRR